MSGVIRLANEKSRARGFLARVFQGSFPTRYFADKKWGGRDAAEGLAREWLALARTRLAAAGMTSMAEALARRDKAAAVIAKLNASFGARDG
jgi:hypothetical protein